MCNRVVRKTQIALCNSIVYVPKQLTVPHNFLMLDRTQTIEHSIKYMASPVTFKRSGPKNLNKPISGKSATF